MILLVISIADKAFARNSTSGPAKQELRDTIQVWCGNDTLKKIASKFLLDNMAGKFAYNDAQISRYDTIFALYEELYRQGNTEADPALVEQCWWKVVQQYGTLNPGTLHKEYDTETITAEYLMTEIETALEAWYSAPEFIAKDFGIFCRYVLPYRVGTEPLDTNRERRFREMRTIRDSLFINDDRLIKELYHEFDRVRHYKNSHLMWSYPISLPGTTIEKARRGSCRHMSEYYVHTLRACGIPATTDYVPLWGNRRQGHEWVVVLKDSGTFVAFDALDRKRFFFTYKPAKILRRTFEIQSIDTNARNHVPSYLIDAGSIDVSHKYFPTFDVEIEGIKAITDAYGDTPYGVICTFDNRDWRPIDYGRYTNGKFYFSNMIGDVCYIAGFYVEDMFIPATTPFILTKSGKIKEIISHGQDTIDMHLTRKYPKFTRITSFSKGLLGTSIEVADSATFADASTIMTIKKRDAADVVDSTLTTDRPYRYIRMKFDDSREGNLAEVVFYGRKPGCKHEVVLNGEFFGIGDGWQEAVDGDYNSYFGKEKNSPGYVAIDLGEKNEYKITRVRYVPRSDTNFIIPGNRYHLDYWDGLMWKSVGEKIADDFHIDFEQVPAGRLYILHNLSGGVEERIFTYDAGKQRWW